LFVFVGLAFVGRGWAQVCTPPPSGIIAWWPGEGNANSIIGSNNGTLQGGATFAPGKVGQAFSLNGLNGFIDVPDNSSLRIPGNLTAEAWINVNSNAFATILSKNTASSTNYNFHVINSLFFALTFDAPASLAVSPPLGVGGCDIGGCFVSGATTVTTGVFHHVAGVYDDSTKTLNVYLDGLLDGTATFTTTGHPVVNSADVFIGVTHTGSSYLNGLIDELSLYNRALTPAEITEVFAAGSAGKCKPGSGPGSARAAYTANAGANTVSVINPATNAVVATVRVGARPIHVAVTPNGDSAYVTNAGANTVSVINTATNTLVATVQVGSNPGHAAVTPDGSLVYVTNAGANTVSVINTATNIVVATVRVGANPVHVAITPDGAHAYVTNAGSNNVSVINTATNTVTTTVPVGTNPVHVAIH
jgi:YVTN family beta-propeller protein